MQSCYPITRYTRYIGIGTVETCNAQTTNQIFYLEGINDAQETKSVHTRIVICSTHDGSHCCGPPKTQLG